MEFVGNVEKRGTGHEIARKEKKERTVGDQETRRPHSVFSTTKTRAKGGKATVEDKLDLVEHKEAGKAKEKETHSKESAGYATRHATQYMNAKVKE